MSTRSLWCLLWFVCCGCIVPPILPSDTISYPTSCSWRRRLTRSMLASSSLRSLRFSVDQSALRHIPVLCVVLDHGSVALHLLVQVYGASFCFNSQQALRTRRFVFLSSGLKASVSTSWAAQCCRRLCRWVGAIFTGLCSLPSFYGICSFFGRDDCKV